MMTHRSRITKRGGYWRADCYTCTHVGHSPSWPAAVVHAGAHRDSPPTTYTPREPHRTNANR